MHAVGWDDGREYLFDVMKQPEILASRARGSDLRSLLYLVSQWRRNPLNHSSFCGKAAPCRQVGGKQQPPLVDLVGRRAHRSGPLDRKERGIFTNYYGIKQQSC